MATPGFKIDIVGFEKQIEKLKIKIAQGAIEGMDSDTCKNYLKNIMKFYIQEEVYDKYNPDLNNPKSYKRTWKLRDNVTATLIGDTLFVYVDDTGMDKIDGGVSYPWRVIFGDSIFPYDHPVEGAGFMQNRDWRYITRDELISHTEQSGILLSIIKNAIERRI